MVAATSSQTVPSLTQSGKATEVNEIECKVTKKLSNTQIFVIFGNMSIFL